MATSISHEVSSEKKVQQLLSTERHETTFEHLKSKLSVRSHNLFLACSMPHASDWLLAPPIPGLGLGLQSDVFRTALKFRLSMPLYDEPFPCQRSAAPKRLVNGYLRRPRFVVTMVPR